MQTKTALGSIVDAGAGDDTIVGTVGTVGDNLLGQAGNDLFTMSTNLQLNDTIVGGIGTDTITMTDATGSTDELNNVSGVEVITLGAATTVIVAVNTLVASGASLTVTGTLATTLNFDGSAETDGSFVLVGSAAGADTLTGGAQADSITSGTGAATCSITGNGGNDTITLDAILTASVETIHFTNASTNGVDTIIRFDVDNTNDDILKFIDTATLQLQGTATGAYEEVAGASIAAAANNVIVITDAQATWTTAAVIDKAIADSANTATGGVIVVFQTGATAAQVWFVAGADTDNLGVGTFQLATLTGVTTMANLDTGNFVVA